VLNIGEKYRVDVHASFKNEEEKEEREGNFSTTSEGKIGSLPQQ